MLTSLKQMIANRIRLLAWAGILGAVIMVIFGINALVAPPQIGNEVVQDCFKSKTFLRYFLLQAMQ